MRSVLISILALAGWLACSHGHARELAVSEADLVTAEILGVQPLPDASMAAVLLQVGDDTFPVMIGMVEAMAIERARLGVQSPRPLTHELLGDVIASADLRMARLVIDELTDDGRYLAALELQPTEGGALRRVDSRPSDGMALAVRSGAPIVVARQVVEKAIATQEEFAPDDPQFRQRARPMDA